VGERAQVKVMMGGVEPSVYLYTHWGGLDLEAVVRHALAKRQRWDDPEYLTRIIFCEMVRGEERESTGFGISTSENGDIDLLITIDPLKQRLRIEDKSRWGAQRNEVMSFDEFINTLIPVSISEGSD